MRFLVHFALILTVSLLLLQTVAAPEIEQAGQLWTQIGTAVHKAGIQ